MEWYDELLLLTASPLVRLNLAVAVGEADGPRPGLAALAALDPELPRHTAVRIYLLERAGDLEQAPPVRRRHPAQPPMCLSATTSSATQPGCGSCCAPEPGCRRATLDLPDGSPVRKQ